MNPISHDLVSEIPMPVGIETTQINCEGASEGNYAVQVRDTIRSSRWRVRQRWRPTGAPAKGTVSSG